MCELEVINLFFCCFNVVFVSGNAPSRNLGGGGGRGRGAGRGRGSGGAGRGRRPVPTAEQLDAELDAYVKEIK